MNRMMTMAVLGIFVLDAGSAADAAPVVPGYERFGRLGTDATAQIEAGLLLVGELGCTNCHAAESAAVHLRSKPAPDLTTVGQRLKPDWLVNYLADPHALSPATTMPNLLSALPDGERLDTATALAHYLAASGPLDRGPLPDGRQAKPREGEILYERAGCAACHGSRSKPEPRLPDQVPLVGIADKWTPKALDAFLTDPLATRPGSRMPAVPLSDRDRRHVVASLLGSLASGNGDDYRDVVAFKGRAWNAAVKKLPAIDTLGPPAHGGPVKGLDVFGFAGLRDAVVIRLDGFFHARSTGPYTFHLESDDGSRLMIDGNVIIDNDGVHPEIERSTTIDLAAGPHAIAVDYFEEAGGEVLRLDVVTPSGLSGSVVGLVTPTADGVPAARPESPAVAGFAIDTTLVDKGRVAFVTQGCTNCHRMADTPGTPVASRREAQPLPELSRLDAGCLAEAAQPAAAWYQLDDGQRQTIIAAITWLKTPEAQGTPTRELTIERTLTSLNCYACHDRDGRGGVLPTISSVDDDGEPVLKDTTRDAFFTSPLQELGDEGRLPPTLTGVGDKLTPEFLSDVLTKGGVDRRMTMNTLMPRFHPDIARPLATLLSEDPHTTVMIPKLSDHALTQINEQGRSLVGSKMLGCIKCHAFGEKGQSLGLIDMTRMPHRLRHEWFMAYVADPQRFRPGTRMPAAWPEGKTFYPDLADGTAAGQIEAVWQYLSGPQPKRPLGVTQNPIELIPSERPIIYRNFIEGAGPRAIAVGHPEKVHFAWDADQLRLALAWRGNFMDASRHWTGRGVGFESPLGDGVFTPDAGTPLAEFSSFAALRSAAWPTGSLREARGPVAGYRFQGYRLDATGTPTFGWRWGDRDVQDHVMPAMFAGISGRPPKLPGLRRTITVSGPAMSAAACRIAVGKSIEVEAEGWYLIDKTWRVRAAGGEVIQCDAAGSFELRVPLVWHQGKAVMVEELTW